METRTARIVNIVLGAWLFVSAFAWHHSAAQFVNTWLMGVFIVVAAILALFAPVFRFVNMAVGLWLIVSSFGMPRTNAATLWNNLIVGLVVLAFSLIGTAALTRKREATRPV